MRVETHASYTTIFLDIEEVRELCHVGSGADTCVWLAAGPKGFECLYYHRHEGRNLEGETLEQMWQAGKTVAKRDGCDKVRNMLLAGTRPIWEDKR